MSAAGEDLSPPTKRRATDWPRASIPWLLVCALCAYWLWHLTWWLASYFVRSAPLEPLAVASLAANPVLLLLGTGLEWLQRRRPGQLAFRLLLALCAAALLSILSALLMFGLRFFVPDFVGAVAVVLLIAGVFALPVLLLVLFDPDRRRATEPSVLRSRLLCLLAATFGIAATLGVWSMATIGIVSASALWTAGASPFCLQVNHGWSYTVVNGWGDLNGFRLSTPHDQWDDYSVQRSFHAVLVVADGAGAMRTYNWSYRQLRFTLLPENQPVTLHCEPAAHFLETMGRHQPAPPPLRRYPPDPPAPPPPPRFPAKTWAEGFWSNMLVRYLSIEALVDVCAVELTDEQLAAVRRAADGARQKLAMSEAQLKSARDGLVLATLAGKASYCDPHGQYQRELLIAVPSAGQTAR